MGTGGGICPEIVSSFGKDVKLRVPCLDAACKVGPKSAEKARNNSLLEIK